MQFVGWGDGHDLVVPSSGTYGGTNVSCSGASGSRTLTCGGTFTVGDMIMIHQSRGTGVSQWEVNWVVSDNGATLTLLYPLSYTYTDSGNSQAQVIEVKEYSSGTISGTFVCNAWDQDKAGIIAFCVSGKLTITGTVNAGNGTYTNKGYIQGTGQLDALGKRGWSGEGTTGVRVWKGNDDGSDNGSGGAGGIERHDGGGGGAGGGNGAKGTNGGQPPVADPVAQGGAAAGNAALTNMVFGGGGGGGGRSDTNAGCQAGAGGGIIVIFARELVTSAGYIKSGGAAAGGGSGNEGGGGGGAGGSILIKTITATIGTNRISAPGGAGNAGGGSGLAGGAGAAGRVRIESCSYTGSANSPTPSYSTGGHDFCGSVAAVIGG